ncbi:MAG: hypothetical protein AB1767_01945 [Bacillota bacterium]
MEGFRAVIGLLIVLALLSLGLILLPAPGLNSTAGLFTALWLPAALAAAAAFGRELWQRERLQRVRRKRKAAAKRGAKLNISGRYRRVLEGDAPINRRERRLD